MTNLALRCGGISRTYIFFFKSTGHLNLIHMYPPAAYYNTKLDNFSNVLSRAGFAQTSAHFSLICVQCGLRAMMKNAKVGKCGDSGGCKSHFTFRTVRKPRPVRKDSI